MRARTVCRMQTHTNKAEPDKQNGQNTQNKQNRQNRQNRTERNGNRQNKQNITHSAPYREQPNSTQPNPGGKEGEREPY